jgi:hypothetical protein
MLFKSKIHHADFLKEKSLWDIFLASRKIKKTKFNLAFTTATFILTSLYCYFEKDTQNIHNTLTKLVDVGLNCSVGLLGFLIAGFTVFATLVKPELLLVMAQRIEKTSGLSFLKYSFFTFTRTFIYFLILIFTQLAVILFSQENSFGGNLIPSEAYDIIFKSTNRIGLVIYVSLWVFSFLQLKSFVFNVHHIVMTMIKHEAVLHKNKFYLK